jgi:hypothetical protein
MRIRTIKPGFWTNEKLSAVNAETALLAIALLNYADDEGYFNANPKLVLGALFPLRELSVSVPVMLKELADIDYISVRIATDGRAYGLVNNFSTHQVISRPRGSELKPLFDACSDPANENHGGFTEPSQTNPGGMEGNGRGKGMEEGKGKARRGRGSEVVDYLPNNQAEPIRHRMLQVNQLTNRKPATRWSAKEFEAFKGAGLENCMPDDFAEQIAPLQTYYAADLIELRAFWNTKGAEDFRRRDLVTVLENWGGEVDRATKFCEHARKKAEEQKSGRL